jgi:hypothetical protein
MWTNNPSGYDWCPVWERALVLEIPRDEYGRFSSDMDDYDTIKLKTESGKIVVAKLGNVEHDYDPSTLSDKELEVLYHQIVKGSLYYADYRNTLGVFENTACDYYEGFVEDLRSTYGSDELADEFDTVENFVDYCKGVEYLRPAISA